MPQPASGGFSSPASAGPFISPGPSPLVASYNEWTSGRAYGQNAALPRDWQTFLSGMFGPLAPIRPVPVDTPEPGYQRPEPRRWQYPVGWDMNLGMPGTEGLGKLANFQTLRVIADYYSVARACIELRKAEIRGIRWEIASTKNAAKAMRGDHEAMKDFAERQAKATRFFRRPDPQYRDFSSWLDAALEEVFVTDALAVYPQPSRMKGKGVLGSSLGALALLDGTLIRPMIDVQGATPRPPDVAFQQYLYGVARVDLMTMALGEDIPDGDALAAEYRADQLMYLPSHPRTWTPYGFTCVERAIVPIMTGLAKQQFALNFFQEGTIPGLFVSPGDANMSPAQIRELQDALNALAGDQAWKHKIIVLPGGSKVDPQKPIILADQFDQIVMLQTCAIPDMEVITRNGLVAMKDIRAGDQVLTHRGRWRAVTKVMTNPVHEPVRRLRANGFDDLEVTGNHPVWTALYSQTKTHRQQYERTEWVAARDVTPKDLAASRDFGALTLPVPIPGPSDARLRLADHIQGKRWWVREENGFLVHSNPNARPLPAYVAMGAAFGRLLGLYMAEGCSSTSSNQVYWYFHEDEVAYQQQVIDDLAAVFGLTAKIRPVPAEKAVKVECSSAMLAELLAPCGPARVKRLPEWAWDGSHEFYASLLWGWVAGDGTLKERGWRGYTVSRTLAWQMRLIAVACGLEPQFRAEKQTKSSINGREIHGSEVIYTVEVVREQQKRGTYRIDGPHLTSPVRSNELSSYDGDVVYNLEVADDHSYVTTGGTVHNCMAFDIMPTELGILPNVSATVTPSTATMMNKATQQIHQRKSTTPLLEWLKSAIFDVIIQDVLHQEDMEWRWEGLEETEDEESLTVTLVEQVGAGLASIDEARMELGREPWGLPITQDPGWATQFGGYQSLAALAAMGPAGMMGPGTQGQQGREQQAPRRAIGSGSQEMPGELPPTGLTARPRNTMSHAQRGRHATTIDLASRVEGPPTPAHSGAAAAHAGTRRAGSTRKGADRELGLLRSHLRKGARVQDWHSRDLPGTVLAMITEDLSKGLSPDQACDVAAGMLASLGKADGTPGRGVPSAGTALQPTPPQAVPPASWPGWYTDSQLAAEYAVQLAAALAAAVSTALLAAQWLAANAAHRKAPKPPRPGRRAGAARQAVRPAPVAWPAPPPAQAPPPAPQQGQQQAVQQQPPPAPRAFLTASGAAAALAAALAAVLAALWSAAWVLGWSAALGVLGGRDPGPAPGWPDGLQAEADARAAAILQTRLAAIEAALMAALRDGLSEDELAARISAILASLASALLVTRSETAWASGAAAYQAYKKAGGAYKRWQTRGDARVCGRCSANQAAGPIPLNARFPSGALTPLEHPRCRCALLPAAAPGARKDAADLTDPNPVEAEHVANLMRANFPEKALRWVAGVHWTGPVHVPLDRIDFGDEDSWAASHQPARVAQFARDMKAGTGSTHPVILVQTPHDQKAVVIDGHHRVLADRELGWPVKAYLGMADEITGPMLETHSSQVHSGADPANKAAKAPKDEVGYRQAASRSRRCGTCVMFRPGDPGRCTLVRGDISPGAVCDRWSGGAAKGTDRPVAAGLAVRAADTGRVLMLQRALVPDDDDPAAGLWEFPGGRLEDGESALEAARREWAEETGCEAPDAEPDGIWNSADGRYRGFVLTVPDEEAVDAFGDRDEVPNPDDPDGDLTEALAWWEPGHLDGNPSVRPELADGLKRVKRALKSAGGTSSAEVLREYWTHEGHPGPTRYALEEKIRWGQPGDWYRCVSELTPYVGPEGAKGYCDLRHHEALGYWPAQHARKEHDE